MTMILIWNENHCQAPVVEGLSKPGPTVGGVLVVNRFRVAEEDAAELPRRARSGAGGARAAAGYADGAAGRNVDDPSLWVMVTRWQDVGSYRRALSTYDVKVGRSGS